MSLVVVFLVDSLSGVLEREDAVVGRLPYPLLEGAGEELRDPTGLCCCFKLEMVLLKKSPSSLEEVCEELDIALLRIDDELVRILLSKLVYSDWVYWIYIKN